MTDLTFLSMLYIWTDVSMLSYVKMVSYSRDLIPDRIAQILNQYGYNFFTHVANVNILHV